MPEVKHAGTTHVIKGSLMFGCEAQNPTPSERAHAVHFKGSRFGKKKKKNLSTNIFQELCFSNLLLLKKTNKKQSNKSTFCDVTTGINAIP